MTSTEVGLKTVSASLADKPTGSHLAITECQGRC
ncbi:hypothetical protein DMI60_25060 [Escherichia coli]|nr:hypothetical protein [Escherichia coli]